MGGGGGYAISIERRFISTISLRVRWLTATEKSGEMRGVDGHVSEGWMEEGRGGV